MTEKNSPPEKKIDKIDKDAITQAQEQAEKDIEKDPDLNLEPEPEDDLDEGELARLEGED